MIFPFEVEEYARAGVAVDYVGHPLVEALRDYRPAEAGPALREELGVPKGAPVLTLLPGSRRNELRYQLPLQLATARALAPHRPGLHCILPLAPSLRADDARPLLARASTDVPVSLVEARAWDAISASDVVLAKPGTATLETALLGRPLVVAGRGHPVSAAILRRLVDVPAWAMPNLIAGAHVVPEFLQEEAVPERIAEALAGLACDGPPRARQLEELARVRERVGGEGATRRVREMAEELLGPART